MEVEDQEKKEIPDLSIINFPHQRIFFGAPGTGKSYLLNKQAKENFGENYERVTFHPNYMYGSFIGTFKPFPVKLKDNNEEFLTDDYGNIKEYITYKYVPGVLMKVLVKALVNPKTNYLLIIEEINRADVSAVFGDFFQLLDRCKNGESQYPIATSEDIKIYFNEIFKSKNILPQKLDYIKDKIGTEYDKIILPNNLYIWATMNSADQGVTYMDTAFKRRWDIVYVGVDDAAKDKEFDNYRFKISPDKTVKWDDFRREINNRLSECRVPEDKLIGPYFISKSILELDNIEIITESIKNKVLMYLYDDAVRGYRNNFFEPEKSKTYSQLCENFDKDGRYIFKRVLEIDSEVYISEESSENEVDNIKKINLDDVDDIDKSISCESNN